MCLRCNSQSGGTSGGGGPQQKVTLRKDYKKPDFEIDHVDLNFQLDPDVTTVQSTLRVARPQRTSRETDLVLNGESIELVSISVNGKVLSAERQEYTVDELTLRVPYGMLPEESTFEVRVENKNFPRANSALSGLYYSDGVLVTQCEAEGFRRITYFLDRPDVMSKYQVRVEANKIEYPVLLSNGDEISREDLGEKHAATFVDPFKKPCYLFAIVCGQFAHLHDTHTTMEVPGIPSHEVEVYVYCNAKYLDRVRYALECVKHAMAWDEQKYGRAYDLNTYRIVCIEAFNAGAMENKSLNTFNTANILAHRDSSCDYIFEQVLATVGHEYFHNWSGNRVTVKDWFQITLKEGFTNFRECQFASDMFSAAVKRIEVVKSLRTVQFKEDSEPLAHSVRPESYVTIDNFYTTTVYDKGSEVIRMMQTLIGEEGFRKGTDLYFSRYDGCPVGCDEFRLAIAEANNRDFTQFENWYKQKGTPLVEVVLAQWNEKDSTYTLKLRQVLPTGANGSEEPLPYHMPIVTGLIGLQSGKEIMPSRVLEMTNFEDTFVFENIKENCLPSVMRGFSAPCKLNNPLSGEELAFMMAHDTDPFNSWEAGQRIYKTVLMEMAYQIMNGKFDLENPPKLNEHLVKGVRQALSNSQGDFAFVALSLELPHPLELMQEMKPIADPLAVCDAVKVLARQIHGAFAEDFRRLFDGLIAESASKPYSTSKEDMARRSLQYTLLYYLTRVPASKHEAAGEEIAKYYHAANNYNDKFVSLHLICSLECSQRDKILAEAYESCHGDSSMLNDWFRSQSMATSPDSMKRILSLSQHPDYKDDLNPNRFCSVARAFGNNIRTFHAVDGSGYKFLADEVARYDKANAAIAALTCRNLIGFQMYSPERQALMKKALTDLATKPLSKNTREVVESAIGA